MEWYLLATFWNKVEENENTLKKKKKYPQQTKENTKYNAKILADMTKFFFNPIQLCRIQSNVVQEYLCCRLRAVYSVTLLQNSCHIQGIRLWVGQCSYIEIQQWESLVKLEVPVHLLVFHCKGCKSLTQWQIVNTDLCYKYCVCMYMPVCADVYLYTSI